jgi:hypothetical protein
MVKLRDNMPTELFDADKAAKIERFGNDALPKKSRSKPANHYRSINIPFTEDDYHRMVAAATKADRKPTDFIKKAIKQAVESVLIQH